MQAHPFYHSQDGFEILQRSYDNALAQWPLPYESVYVETAIGRTHVLTCGDEDKPALLYFHGWNGNAAGNYLELDLPRLTRFYRVFMPDTPGHTGRSEQVRPDTKGTAFVRWVQDLCDHFELQNIYVAGVSGGGYIASKVAAHMPGRIQAALGIVPFGIPAASRPPLSFYFIVASTYMLGEKGVQRFVKRMGSTTQQPSPQQLAAMSAHMQLLSRHYKSAWNPAPLADEELRSISCPFHILFSEKDIFINTHAAVKRARRLMPTAEVRVLREEGHLLSAAGWRESNDIVCSWRANA